MSTAILSTLLRLAVLLLVILAAATLIPAGGARMISDLGYHTFCPFAPYSTGSLLLAAGVAHVVRKHVDALPKPGHGA